MRLLRHRPLWRLLRSPNRCHAWLRPQWARMMVNRRWIFLMPTDGLCQKPQAHQHLPTKQARLLDAVPLLHL